MADGIEEQLRAQRAQGYESARPDLMALIPESARNILEFGCSSGELGAAIKARQSARIHGVELSVTYAADARTRLDRVDESSVEMFLASGVPDDAPYDCLIVADILEHLVDPWTSMSQAVRLLSPGAIVVMSLPNVLWGPGLIRVVRTGRWPRDPSGVFDGTHLRWFGLEDALDLLRQSGLEPRTVVPSIWKSGIRHFVKRKILWHSPLRRFQAAQYLITAERPVTPHVSDAPDFHI
jgi:SAM-dependent methyltransferase